MVVVFVHAANDRFFFRKVKDRNEKQLCGIARMEDEWKL